jgi:hypothetical protein
MHVADAASYLPNAVNYPHKSFKISAHDESIFYHYFKVLIVGSYACWYRCKFWPLILTTSAFDLSIICHYIDELIGWRHTNYRHCN